MKILKWLYKILLVAIIVALFLNEYKLSTILLIVAFFYKTQVEDLFFKDGNNL